MVTAADQFAEIDSFSLRYRLYGSEENPLAVIGHGIFSSLDQYADRPEALDVLAERYRILLYDARGHGESEGPEEPDGYSWQALGEEMLALAALAGEERPILGGASMSASAALWVGVQRPETAARARPHRASAPRPPRAAGRIRDRGPAHARHPRHRRRVLRPLRHRRHGRHHARLHRRRRRRGRGDAAFPEPPHHHPHHPRPPRPHPARPADYGAIRCPVVVFAHPDDALHPIRSANLLAEHIPDCRLHVGPERDYWQNHPEELAREIIAFLDTVP